MLQSLQQALGLPGCPRMPSRLPAPHSGTPRCEGHVPSRRARSSPAQPRRGHEAAAAERASESKIIISKKKMSILGMTFSF